MIVAKFKIGDRVIVKDSDYKASIAALVGSGYCLSYDTGETGTLVWNEADLVLEPTPQGPVRTKTVAEIVPGEYGIVRILETPQTPFPMHVNLRIDHGLSSAKELRAAAIVLTQIAEALEE